MKQRKRGYVVMTSLIVLVIVFSLLDSHSRLLLQEMVYTKRELRRDRVALAVLNVQNLLRNRFDGAEFRPATGSLELSSMGLDVDYSLSKTSGEWLLQCSIRFDGSSDEERKELPFSPRP